MTDNNDTRRPAWGYPDNPETRRAAVDAVLLLQAIHRDDDAAQTAIMTNCDPFSVAGHLAGFVLATFRQYDVNAEERLAVWLAAVTAQAGEDVPA